MSALKSEKEEVVENEVEGASLTRMLSLCTATVCIGSSMEFGYNLGVVTAPSLFIQDFMNETFFSRSQNQLSENALTWLWATVVSIYCVGGALGALIGGYWADHFGRNRGLIYNNFVSIIGSLLMGCCQVAASPEMLIIGRFVIGVSCGISITIVPVYLAEISPINLRGAISMTSNLLITTGILVAQVLGFYAFYNERTWPTVFGLSAVSGFLEFLILPFCPESPRWLLMTRNDEEGAVQALRKLRDQRDVDEEIREMKIERENAAGMERVGVMDVICLRDPNWKMPLLICIVLHAGLQFSGINAILFFSTEVYQSAGMSDTQVAFATVGIGCMLVATAVVLIIIVERLGRRTLLLYPFGTQALWLAGLTASVALQHTWTTWLSLAFVYLYMISFGMGSASVPYLVSAEVWSQAPRPAGMSISMQVNWWTNFIVQVSFPSMLGAINEYVFLIYMACALVTAIFVFFYVPETKNRSFDDIVSHFRIKYDEAVDDGTIYDTNVDPDNVTLRRYEMKGYENKGQQTDEDY